MGNTLAGLLGLGGLASSAYLPYEESGEQIDYLKEQIPSYVDQAADITQRAVDEAQFTPFTVKTGTGTSSIGAGGGLTQTLGQTPAAIQSDLLGSALTAAGGLGANLPSDTSSLASQGVTGALGALGQVKQYDQGIDASRAATQNLLSSQLDNLGSSQQGLSNLASTAFANAGNLQGNAADVTGLFEGIQAPQVSTAAGDMANQYMTAGSQALGQTTPTAQSVYDQIRSMQSPEEERQRIALENRLAAQGRLGVGTAMYGGTPEELALEKAQAEARNSAAYQAINQADQLATAQQNRAQQLSQMGLSAEQVQAQLNSEGFGQQMQLAGSNLSAQQAQSALTSEAQNRATQMANLGLTGLQAGSALESQQLQNILGLQQADIGAAQAQQGLQTGALNIGSGMFNIGQQAAALPSTLQSQDLANLQSMLGAAYLPEQQQLQALQAASPFSQLATSAALSRAEQLSSGGQYGLEALAAGNQAIAGLESARVQALANTLQGMFTASSATEASPLSIVLDELGIG